VGVSDRASEGASGRLDVLMIDSMAPGEAFAEPQGTQTRKKNDSICPMM
jgi:hypothetical protein